MQSPGTARADRPGRLRGARLVDVEDDDLGTLGDDGPGDGRPDAPGAAGHDGLASIQPAHVTLPCPCQDADPRVVVVPPTLPQPVAACAR